MNNGRIWCVVKPTVGLPLFLGGVAVISLTVHSAVLTNTTWMAGFFQGRPAARADAAPMPSSNVAQAPADAGFSVSVTPVVANSAGSGTTFVITITPRAGEPTQVVTLAADGSGPPTAVR